MGARHSLPGAVSRASPASNASHDPGVRGRVVHLYIHAPFCRRRCVYCDFAVHVSGDPGSEGWEGLVAEEWRLWKEAGVTTASDLRTVYVGGGTPSVLPADALPRLASSIGLTGESDGRLEWTVEANPESFSGELAKGWARTGVNRISLGVQTFSPHGLRWMGRLHGPSDVTSALRHARSAGITNLSVDLILGLPDDVDRSWEEDLTAVLSLDVPHLSVYGLTVEKGTPLARQIDEGRSARPSDERYRREFLDAAERLAAAGYVQYEVSNFALPGFESRHNRAYWDRSEYLGLGNGAHSFVGGVRWWNLRSWVEYRAALEAGHLPLDGHERPSPAQAHLESLWLQLRTREGIALPAGGTRASALLSSWTERGLARVTRDAARLTPAGWLVLDDLVLELDRALMG